jgi:hypothetical protein
VKISCRNLSRFYRQWQNIAGYEAEIVKHTITLKGQRFITKRRTGAYQQTHKL